MTWLEDPIIKTLLLLVLLEACFIGRFSTVTPLRLFGICFSVAALLGIWLGEFLRTLGL